MTLYQRLILRALYEIIRHLTGTPESYVEPGGKKAKLKPFMTRLLKESKL